MSAHSLGEPGNFGAGAAMRKASSATSQAVPRAASTALCEAGAVGLGVEHRTQLHLAEDYTSPLVLIDPRHRPRPGA